MADNKQTNKNSKPTSPWFYRFRDFLNNRWLQILVILILLVLFIYLCSKITYLLLPIGHFIGTMVMPVVIAGTLYYMTVPLVNFLEKKFHWRRMWGAWLVLILLALFIVLLATLLPILFTQSQALIENWRDIWAKVYDEMLALNDSNWLASILAWSENWLKNWLQTSSSHLGTLWSSAVSGLGSIFDAVTNVLLALFTAPILLFYLLKDSPKFEGYFKRFIPIKMRHATVQLVKEMNLQISAYIRGQVMIGIAVAIMFMIGYNIIGLQYSFLISFFAGILNLIPYLGSFLAMIPAFIIGAIQGPWMVVQVLIVFLVEQTIESRIISPQILGNNLDIHPVTIMLLLIAGGKSFGLFGIIFIIPLYAILKLAIKYIFVWYRDVSGLYEE